MDGSVRCPSWRGAANQLARVEEKRGTGRAARWRPRAVELDAAAVGADGEHLLARLEPVGHATRSRPAPRSACRSMKGIGSPMLEPMRGRTKRRDASSSSGMPGSRLALCGGAGGRRARAHARAGRGARAGRAAGAGARRASTAVVRTGARRGEVGRGGRAFARAGDGWVVVRTLTGRASWRGERSARRAEELPGEPRSCAHQAAGGARGGRAEQRGGGRAAARAQAAARGGPLRCGARAGSARPRQPPAPAVARATGDERLLDLEVASAGLRGNHGGSERNSRSCGRAIRPCRRRRTPRSPARASPRASRASCRSPSPAGRAAAPACAGARRALRARDRDGRRED